MKKVFTLFSAIVMLAFCNTVSAELWTITSDMKSDKWTWYGQASSSNILFSLSTNVGSQGPTSDGFTLQVQHINSGGATFTQALVDDNNYWEPYFKRTTQQMAGEEMTAQDNVKTLVIDNVAVLPGQFKGYNELKSISFFSSGDYNIPDGLFSELTSSKERAIYCTNVSGTLTLGSNIFPGNDVTRNVKIYTSSETHAKLWNDYKAANNGLSYQVYLNGQPYDETSGDQGDSNTPKINSVIFNGTMNGSSSSNLNLPAESMKFPSESNSVTELKVNSFTVNTTGQISEVYMEYRIRKGGEGYGNPWNQLKATNQGNGVWTYTGPFDALTGLDSNHNYYVLEFSFQTDNGEYGRASYPNSGSSTYTFEFITGDLPTAVQGVSESVVNTNAPKYSAAGARVGDGYKGIVIQGGKKVMQ